MADAPTKKVSAFPVATTSVIADSIPIIQGGANKRIHPGSGGGLDADTVDGFQARALMPAGAMLPFAGSSVPSGWLLCVGQAVSRATYADLYSAISTTWGVGNGSTTFNVPDMREAAPIGAGTYSAVTGTTHGAITAHDARALGAFADDQGQGHKHGMTTWGTAHTPGSAGLGFGTADCVQQTGLTTDAPVTDGTNGTPRTGTVTRGKTIGVNYIIKY